MPNARWSAAIAEGNRNPGGLLGSWGGSNPASIWDLANQGYGNIPLPRPNGVGTPGNNSLARPGSGTTTIPGTTVNPLAGSPYQLPSLYSMGQNSSQPPAYQPPEYTQYGGWPTLQDQGTGPGGRSGLFSRTNQGYSGTPGNSSMSNRGTSSPYQGNTFRGSFRRRTPGGYMGY